ncbi:cytidine triphosphate synthase, putative [Bodo saltans]|uniref:CTP synthase n=1 Tax=Bodo saltans TaxID=75058 RepID=A0A0S4J2W0_BODSA|nr:cytidine triphosphate synthase, putative [Bodo saltans]|eukprot:CUG67568.1 cytidine triphosphate synthase, putative [Bodo saltans]
MTIRTGNSYYLPSPMLRPADAAVEARTKFILVTGGVCSSLGKGVTTSSVGALLRSEGFRVSSIKIDPYVNVDAGLMSPFEHGEVYVLQDGGEVDLDLGNYERWLSVHLRRDHNITTGKVYNTLIQRERQGKYLGKTVQVVPHFTNEVVEHILRVSQIPVDGSGLKPQVCMIELGGTVGDLESAPFVEALRTLRFMIPPEDFCLIHCTYLPVMGGGQKTKPSQHSCRTLLSSGLMADFLVCRSEHVLAPDCRKKLSQQCGIQEKDIIGAHNVPSMYQVPVEFHRQGMVDRVLHKLRLDRSAGMPALDASVTIPDVNTFAKFANILQNPQNKVVRIGFVGKYVSGGSDAYFSVLQTFEHCCIALEVRLDIVYVDSEMLEGKDAPEATALLLKCDGIFVAGGFGVRGIDGKVAAAKLARENDIPYFGVCLGMQVALIELARNLLGHADANSAEFNPTTTNPVVRIMDCDKTQMGANMHLGLREVHLIEKDSIMTKIYGGADHVLERHRHRYEFNMEYFQRLKDVGVRFSGVSDASLGPLNRVEAIEIPKNRFFLAVQYHPEFITTPVDPSPPFLAFVAAAARKEFAWPTTINSRGAPAS